MKLLKSTKEWAKYWEARPINWEKEYLDNWDHPHRDLISAALSQFQWVSIFEVGCAAGANLKNIIAHFKGKQVGGCDVAPEAIAVAERSFQGGLFKVGSVLDIPISDKATDVVLADMCLIYIDPLNIKKALEEIRRVSRNYVVFCEFHHKSWWKRFQLRWNSGYNAYNYRKLLAKHGFYDIQLFKIPQEFWPGGDPQKTYGYIIKARVARRG